MGSTHIFFYIHASVKLIFETNIGYIPNLLFFSLMLAACCELEEEITLLSVVGLVGGDVADGYLVFLYDDSRCPTPGVLPLLQRCFVFLPEVPTY